MTNKHTELKKLIEEANPEDHAQLDQIDRLFHSYLENSYIEVDSTDNYPQYTRDSKHLKRIKPYSWCGYDQWVAKSDNGVSISNSDIHSFRKKETLSPMLPTEELAMIYAIVSSLEKEEEDQGEFTINTIEKAICFLEEYNNMNLALKECHGDELKEAVDLLTKNKSMLCNGESP